MKKIQSSTYLPILPHTGSLLVSSLVPGHGAESVMSAQRVTQEFTDRTSTRRRH